MEKETKRTKQKRLIRKVLIGIGITGVSILVIKALINGKHKQNECHNLRNACKLALKTVEVTAKKEDDKPDVNGNAIVRQCNELLKALWKRKSSGSKLYYDDEIYIDIKNCPFPPYIRHKGI